MDSYSGRDPRGTAGSVAQEQFRVSGFGFRVGRERVREVLTRKWKVETRNSTRFLQGGTSGAARWTAARADEHDSSVKVGVVSFRLTLGPAPLTKNALVNEGEGTDFVCHIGFDARMGQTLSYGGTGPWGQGTKSCEARNHDDAGEKTPTEYRVHGIGGRAKPG